MNPIIMVVKFFSIRARKNRAIIFRKNFELNENTKILDLGSENGKNIHNILHGTQIKPENVYIADISPDAVQEGNKLYGYNPIVLEESCLLPFSDCYFDIVYCSSVIEHVTIPKDKIWNMYSGKEFKKLSLVRQKEFANEIERVGKEYFVQTPYKHFPIESHTWLPFIMWFPRSLLISFLKLSNRYWVKKSSPDWNLLNKREMSALFKKGYILDEKSFGLTKSIMAIKKLNAKT